MWKEILVFLVWENSNFIPSPIFFNVLSNGELELKLLFVGNPDEKPEMNALRRERKREVGTLFIEP